MSSFFVNANTDTTGISNLLRTQVPLRTTIERLSAGLHIQTAEEDAAGFAAANRVTNVIGVSRTMNTTSRLQTAEQSLGRLQARLNKLRGLAAGAADDSFSGPQLNSEFQNLLGTLDPLAFEIGLARDGELARQMSINIGTDTPTAVDLSNATVDTRSLGLTTESGPALDISTTDGAQAALAAIDTASNRVAEASDTVSGAVNRVFSAVAQAADELANTTPAASRITNSGIAQATANVTRNQIVEQANAAVASQANLDSNAVLSLFRG